MIKSILAGLVVAAATGALVGVVNASLGGPAWLAGSVAGFVGALAVGLIMRATRKK